MAPCMLCASLQVNRLETHFTTKDEAGSHAAQHLLQTKHFDDENCSSLDQVFEQCFPNFIVIPVRKQKKIAKEQGRRSILEVFHTVIKGRIPKDSAHVACLKCRSRIVLCGGKNKWIRIEIAIDHASGHLGIDLFECRQCGRTFGSIYAVRSHLMSSHGLRCLPEYCTDKSHDFIDEITSSIEQCFPKRNNSGSSDVKTRTLRLQHEAKMRSRTKGSKLVMERQLLCYRLITKLAGDDGKIQCRICPKKIGIKQKSGYKVHSALAHALVHLKKPLFRCKVCSNIQNSRALLYLHLKSAHALQLPNNYECLADEYHADVMGMLRKCYADEPGKLAEVIYLLR